jgi:hypothetical protein
MSDKMLMVWREKTTRKVIVTNFLFRPCVNVGQGFHDLAAKTTALGNFGDRDGLFFTSSPLNS